MNHEITLELRFGLIARPRVVLGPHPAAPAPPLPDLDPHPPAAAGFHVWLDVRVPFDLLSEQITAKVRGTPIHLEPLGTLEIEQVAVYATEGGKLVIRVGFAGAAHGDAYFLGTPTFDRTQHVISMPDLDFTLSTRNLLLNLAAPIVHLHRFTEMLREKATYDISPLIERNVSGVLRAFNQSVAGPAGTKVQLSGKVQDVQFGGIAVEGEALVVRGVADGNAGVTIEGTSALEARGPLPDRRAGTQDRPG